MALSLASRTVFRAATATVAQRAMATHGHGNSTGTESSGSVSNAGMSFIEAVRALHAVARN